MGVFVLKLQKWFQIAQRITNTHLLELPDNENYFTRVTI